MAPHVTCRTILVPATGTRRVDQGFLIFSDDVLMAVAMRLDRSAHDPDLCGHWFLEAGYGPNAVPPGPDVMFRSRYEAQAWMLERVIRTRENHGPQCA